MNNIVTLVKKNIYVIVLVVMLIIIFSFVFYRNFNSLENFSPIDIEVLPKYKDITPVQLYKLFDNNIDKMTQAMIQINIPIQALKTPSYYPKIASMLEKNKLI